MVQALAHCSQRQECPLCANVQTVSSDQKIQTYAKRALTGYTLAAHDWLGYSRLIGFVGRRLPRACVTEVNGDLKRLVATYNASHGTSATTSFSVHSDMAPNVYVNGNPARDSATARNLEKAMSDMSVTNPLSGQNEKLFVAMADPVEEKLLHMVTADPARTPTFTPFAAGDYFLNAAPGTPTTCTNNDLSNCVFLPSTAPPPNQTFAWNHGGVQPEIRTTWIGWVGPGIEKKKQTDDVWTDHTDIRPTMLAQLGLKDDYVSDGRVVTEFLKGDATPKALQAHNKTIADLGAMWKQINASFGQFSLDTLCASTGALASTSTGDTTYSAAESALESLGAQRDTLAGTIREALWNAEFNGQKIDEKQAKDWIKQGQDYLDQASALCGQFSSTSDSSSKELGKIKHIVVIYEENHSFDNLFGGWEGVNGRSNVHQTGVGDHVTQVDQNGAAYGCLKQLDVNLTSPAAHEHVPGRGARDHREQLPEHVLHDRRLHQAGGRDVPADHERVRFRQRDRQEQPTGGGAAGRLHPRPGARVLPGAVPASRRDAGPLHER